jgi:hypothetical protein
MFPKEAMTWHTDEDSQEEAIVFQKVFGAIADYALNTNKLKFESTTIQLEALAVFSS